jgi:hypothetical protein
LLNIENGKFKNLYESQFKKTVIWNQLKTFM